MRVVKFCKNCNKKFVHYTRKSDKYPGNYCSTVCHYTFRKGKKQVLAWSRKYQSCLMCKGTNYPYHANGYCRKCHNQLPEVKAMKTQWAKTHTEHLRKKNKEYRNTPMGRIVLINYHHKRRKEVINSHTDITTAFLKDLWLSTTTCCVCKIQLEENGKYPNGKHLDHTISLHLGGRHVRSNVRYICARCNLAKSW